MTLALIAGSAHPELAATVAVELGKPLAERSLDRFPDGELHAAVAEDLHDDDVCIVQPTGPPVNENLFELLLLADACRRAGASRITALIPYFGYARQDRRTAPGEALGARVAADLLQAARIDRLLVVDPHTPAQESVFGVPADCLSAVPVLASAVRDDLPADAVVVAPDLGSAVAFDKAAVRVWPLAP